MTLATGVQNLLNQYPDINPFGADSVGNMYGQFSPFGLQPARTTTAASHTTGDSEHRPAAPAAGSAEHRSHSHAILLNDLASRRRQAGADGRPGPGRLPRGLT